MAQAGGTDASALPAALAQCERLGQRKTVITINAFTRK
ncbi:hypothetical protein MJ588_22070 [Klebsiella pneumoniae]|nr:hypothetical protein MJ588_22070 [Klebsiella pneumoniae]